MKSDEIIAKLAEIDPETDNDMGDVYCFFCGADLYGSKEDKHESDCIWVAAKKLVGTEK